MSEQDFLRDSAVYVISVAAELAGMHPQTLRQYDRIGLVSPRRASGRGRRYSPRDIELLKQIQSLSQDSGINLAGIAKILELQAENERLRNENRRLKTMLMQAQRIVDSMREKRDRMFAASASGDIYTYRRGDRPVVSGGEIVPLSQARYGPSRALVVRSGSDTW